MLQKGSRQYPLALCDDCVTDPRGEAAWQLLRRRHVRFPSQNSRDSRMGAVEIATPSCINKSWRLFLMIIWYHLYTCDRFCVLIGGRMWEINWITIDYCIIMNCWHLLIVRRILVNACTRSQCFTLAQVVDILLQAVDGSPGSLDGNLWKHGRSQEAAPRMATSSRGQIWYVLYLVIWFDPSISRL